MQDMTVVAKSADFARGAELALDDGQIARRAHAVRPLDPAKAGALASLEIPTGLRPVEVLHPIQLKRAERVVLFEDYVADWRYGPTMALTGSTAAIAAQRAVRDKAEHARSIDQARTRREAEEQKWRETLEGRRPAGEQRLPKDTA